MIAKIAILTGIILGLAPTGTLGQSISETAYAQIVKAEEALAQNNAQTALTVLEKLIERSGNPYTRAIAYELVSVGHAENGDYHLAAKALRDALAENALDKGARRAAQFNLARMRFAADDVDGALEILLPWFLEAEAPSANAYSLLAHVYVRQQLYAEALVPALSAVSLSGEADLNRYQLLVAIQYELGNIVAMANTLKKMINLWPDQPRHWKRLAWAYQTLEDYGSALSVLELAYKKGHLNREEELLRLAGLYLHQGIPARAANVLETGIARGRIAETEDNLTLLGNTLSRAEESQAALGVLERAAELSGDARIYRDLARSYLDREQWEKAASTAKKAIDLPDGGNQGSLLLTLGIAKFETGDLEAAETAFRGAFSHPEVSEAAKEWLSQTVAQRRSQGQKQ